MALKKLLSGLVSFGLALASSSWAQASLSFDPDVPADLRQQVEQDLSVVPTLQGDSSSLNYRAIFDTDGINGQALLKFFEDRIKGFGMNDCGGGPTVAACVIPHQDNHKMWITPNYTRFSLPQIYRLSILFHESRHTEDRGGYWLHEICPTPYRDENGNDIKGIFSGALMAGRPSCDTTIWGAYGLHATFLKNIEHHCTTCSDKVKQDAQLFGDDTLMRISDPSARKELKQDLSQ